MTELPLKVLIGISFAMLAIPANLSAQSKFIYDSESPDQPSTYSPLTSCELPPTAAYVVITGMRDGDTYIAQTSPTPTGNYVTSFYPFESFLEPVSPFMVTMNAEAGATCDRIASGDTSTEALSEFRNFLEMDAYWWEIVPYNGGSWDVYSPRAPETPLIEEAIIYQMPSGELHKGNVFVSARLTSTATEAEFAEAQKRIAGTGMVDIIERGMAATVTTLEGQDTDNAVFESAVNARDFWRSCAFNTGAIEGSLEATTDTPPVNGVSTACYNFEEYTSDYTGEITRANCAQNIIYIDRQEPFNMIEMYQSGSIYSYRSVYSDFAMLCPESNQNNLQIACDNGFRDACGYMDSQ